MKMKMKYKEDIFNMIKDQKMIKVSELEQRLSIPRTSLLRYLSELEDDGKILKKFGEVQIRSSDVESLIYQRLKSEPELKRMIAKNALPYIREGETIFIDAGSTTYFLAEMLKDKEIDIFTNNLLVFSLINNNYKPVVHLLPGRVNKLTLAAASSLTVDVLSEITFDRSFLGFNSLVDGYFATTNEDEMIVKKTVIKNTKTQSYALGRSDKTKGKSLFRFASLNDVQLVTEKGGP